MKKVFDDHFAEIIHFLSIEVAPAEYTTQQKKELICRATDFSLIAGHLYKMGPDEILHKYVPEHEQHSILAEAHDGVIEGHYVGKATVQQILGAGLWWPMMHKDSKEYRGACDVCQRIGRPLRRDELSLTPQVTSKAFDKWVINFVGPINLSGKKIGV